MNFDFSDEQKQLQDTARRFLQEESPISRVRAVLDGAEHYDRALWRGLADLGFTGAAIPERYGGAGLGYLELCVIADELGRALAPVPFASTVYMFAELLKLAGSEEQKQAHLPKIAAGDRIGTLVASDAAADIVAADGRLSGVKMPVLDGGCADFAVVMARIPRDAAQSLFLVDLNGPGVIRTPVKTLDPTRKHARIEFDGAPAEPLGSTAMAPQVLSQVYDRVAVLTAFEQIGGATRALEMARDYALQRMAFGRPIGSFQAIKHMLADMYVSATLARSNAYYGAWALSTDAAELPIAAATARVSATQAFHHCASNNIQVHGGMGFTWEFDCHLFYRRAHLLAVWPQPLSHWESELIARMRRRNAA